MHNAHANALVIDRRHYVTCASSALYELRYNKSSQVYFLHTAYATYKLNADAAHVVYKCILRHIVRTTAKDVRAMSMRNSVYLLRSDFRYIAKQVECAKFAH